MEKTDAYYVFDRRTGAYARVDGVRVTIEGFEEIDLFAHKSLGDPDRINISEGMTGARIAQGIDEEEASVAAVAVLLVHGVEKICERIRQMIREHGLSPRYEGAYRI